MSEPQQQPVGVPEGWFVVPPSTPPPAPPAAALPDVSKHAGVPVAGRGTQIDPEKSQRAAATAYDTATTPLAHPTGVDMIDGFTSPVGLASLVAGGAGIVRAGMTGGATAAAKTALADAAPMVKYEATKALLMRLGVPQSMASVAAAAVSGIKKGAKEAPVAAPHAPTAEGYSRYEPNVSGYQPEATPASVAPASPVASAPAAAAVPTSAAPSTAAPPPIAEAPPSAPSPQRVLNEQAIAARRAAYQASIRPEAPPADVMQRLSPATAATVQPKTASFGPQGILNMEIQGPNGPQSVGSVVAEMQKAGTPQAQIDRWLQGLERSASQPPAAPTAAKATLKASESPEYMRLIKAGKTHQQAMDVIQANRLLQERLGLSTPTAADTRFPKGQRGKVDPQ